MKAYMKVKIILSLFLIGAICMVMVVLSAYATELKYEYNNLVHENEIVQGEIDTLRVKIKSANSIEHIESVATEKLGMVHSERGEYVYLNREAAPDADFAMSLRKRAYN